MKTRRITLITALTLHVACTTNAQQLPLREPDWSTSPTIIGELDFDKIPEASGLAVSRIDPDRLWFVNDQGNKPELIAVDLNELEHTVIKVDGVKNRDWEELANFTLDGDQWLVIADVGDNKSRRSSVHLVFVKEPESLPANRQLDGYAVKFEYPDGPRDVEAIAADVTRDAIWLLSKRTKPPVLYSLPLKETLMQALNGTKGTLRAVRHGEVNTIPAPTSLELKLFPKYGEFRNQPTAMDVSADGRFIVLMTYGESYLIRLGDDLSWLEAMNGELIPINMPILAQPETIAFSADNGIILSTERERAPLLRYSSREIDSE